jgi:hypothetical protein
MKRKFSCEQYKISKTTIFLNTIVLFILLFSFNVSAQTQVFVDWNSQWSYFKGTQEPSQPITLWRSAGFNDLSWPKGNAPFRYGDGSGGTLLSDMINNYTTFYIRKNFVINSTDDIDQLKITIDYDDGFVVWINGIEVWKINVLQNYSYTGGAVNTHEFGEWESIILDKKNISLNNGSNVIAIQGFNFAKNSSDFYLNTKVEGIKKLPETDAVVTIDIQSGFYNSPFWAKLSGSAPSETIFYTIDGSDPRTSSTFLTGKSPVNVWIDPNSNEGGRGKTGGVVVRASQINPGLAPGKPTTNSYIFVSAVKIQPHPGGNWPTNNVNGQLIDLPMDSKIYNDVRYKNLMESSLLDIPTISVSTDPANLFGSQQGIYVNAENHGREWERPANIELINPDGSPGFKIDAGLRIRGGWSRHDDYPKHAFRLFFRSEYGAGKLNFPLFGDEGVNEFDKVDLRTSQNYSWANGGNDAKHNTMNRDVFSRDSQRDMNRPYTRSRYYHLYLNGLYWGVYQTQERAEANFAETYFGGDKDDYDVIKVDIGENFNLYEIEATDGNTDAWEAIWNMSQQGFASNLNYFKLIGNNYLGVPDTSMNVWVDIDNLIDYMLVIFYGGNFDAPVSKFSQNYNPNNFYAIDNRVKKRDGFKFFAHDAEHSLLTDPAGPGIGLYENRVNIGSIPNMKMNVTYFGKFHPQWLHFKLTENKEYRMRFADRVYRHFFNTGVFVPDSCISRFKKTSDQLDLAIIAESARWGDSKSSTARNKFDHWIPAVNRVVNDYMPYRSEIVLQQLLTENLYVNLNPPVFKNGVEEITDSKIIISENYNLTMLNPNGSGSILYTTDGTDPRAVGGGNSNLAISAGNSANIIANPGTVIKARVRYTETWSALHEIIFEDSGLFSDLKITELHYHPANQGNIDHKELEFIELKNIGTKTLDLSGLAFTDGIQFAFPTGTTLSPNSFMVIASNGVEFENFYGFAPHFVYSGSLSNGGEKIVFQTSSNQIVFSFTYDDELPWPEEADGDGFSLVSAQINPTGNPNNVDYWKISKNKNGSPMDNDLGSVTGTTVVSTANRFEFRIYPNPSSSEINIEFMLDEPEKIEIGLFDINGRLIRILANEHLSAGYRNQTVSLTSLNLKPGIYLIYVQTENEVSTQKIIYNP